MKLRIGENNINDIALATDDGQDFFKILNDNGLIVENMRILGLEPQQMPRLTLTCYVTGIDVEIPADHCGIVIHDKRANSRDVNDNSR
jgi:hypothetical protein